MNTRTHYSKTGLLSLTCLLATACVSSGKYETAVKNADVARAELQKERADSNVTKAALEKRAADLQRQLDNATAEDAELRSQLSQLGKSADELLSEKGTLASALDESRARLAELRRAQAAAEQRAQLYRDLAVRLKKMVDAGDLSIALRDGRMVLQLPNDVLFDTGRTAIKPGGKEALKQVAQVLATLGDRHFQVTGHTDNVPIANAQFASNWELSAARGLEVVHFLVKHGVSPACLAAAGYAEFDPVAGNDDDAGRARNRRIEIALQPDVEELVAIPDVPEA